jgi:hypothetical protein
MSLPSRAERLPAYRDGTYLVSGMGDANTWAVCDQGRWGLVYEYEEVQILAAWVQTDDLPLHVLLEALDVQPNGRST